MRVHIDDSVLYQELAGEAVLLSTRTGQYFGLDDVGTRIFALLRERGQFEPVLAAITEEFAVSPSRARDELDAFVESLAMEGLIHVDPV
jgi:hypothetical protein